MNFLRQGLPPKVPSEFTEPDMCIPILPNTEHPAGREPLRPVKPLPWPNCYLSSGDKITVWVPPTRGNRPELAINIDFDYSPEYFAYHREDNHRRGQLRKAAQASLQQQINPKEPHGQEAGHSSQHLQANESNSQAARAMHLGGSQSWPSSRDPSMSQASDAQDEDEDEDEEYEGPNLEHPLLAFWTYDLSTVDSVSDPEDYYKELAMLKRYVMNPLQEPPSDMPCTD